MAPTTPGAEVAQRNSQQELVAYVRSDEAKAQIAAIVRDKTGGAS